MEVTGRDVGKAAGVSAATVSRVFGRHPGIGAETRERVLAAARRLGYSPQARGGLKTVAVLTPSREMIPLQAHVDMVLAWLSPLLTERGYRMEIIPGKNVDLLRTGAHCGAIMLGRSYGGDDWVGRFPMPLVCVNYLGKVGGDVHAVRSDDDQAMAMAVERLRRSGHRRIALALLGSVSEGTGALRLAGFRKAMAGAGLAVEESLVRSICQENLFEQLGLLLGKGATALIGSGETLGHRLAYGLHLFRKRVPEEVSLIAYEWSGVSEYCVPPLTTLCQDVEGLARLAVETLEFRLAGGAPPSSRLLPCRLIERESVGPALV